MSCTDRERTQDRPPARPPAGPGQPQPAEHIDRRGWIALVCIALGVSVVIMDATIVNVALPVVITDLRLTAVDAQWINAAYSLVFAALLLTLGRLGDLRGRRRLLIAGLALFMIASAVAAASTSAGMLIAARLTQGLGAALITPSSRRPAISRYRRGGTWPGCACPPWAWAGSPSP